MLAIQILCGLLIATTSSILAVSLEEPLLGMHELEDAAKSSQFLDKGKGKLVEFNKGEINKDEINKDEINKDEINKDEINKDEIDELYPQREKLSRSKTRKELGPSTSSENPPSKTFADIPDSQLTLEERRIKYGQSWAYGGKAAKWVVEHILKPPFNSLKKIWRFLTTPIVKGDKVHPDEAVEILEAHGLKFKVETQPFAYSDPSTWIKSQRKHQIIVDPTGHETPQGDIVLKPPLGYPVRDTHPPHSP